LEVVETGAGRVEGSLLHFVDHCKTPFGKRQIKKWLISPLLNIGKIEQRLDAVEELIRLQYETDQFRSRVGKLPDLERLLAKIYTYSIKSKIKAIYFENVSLQKLKDFRTLLKTFKSLPEIIEPLKKKLPEM